MNPYEFPLFFEVDCGSDDAWLMKDAAAISSNIDFDLACKTFSDITDDSWKSSRLTSEAMTIPQIGFIPERNKEFLESPSFLDPDTNFYEHFDDGKYISFPNASISAETCSPLSMWDTPVEMDQPRFDEIFQVEESKAIQGPTLAQLNSNSEPPFDTFSFNDIYTTEEIKPSMNDSFLTKIRKKDDLVTNVSEQNVPMTNRSEMFLDGSQIKREETRGIYLPCKSSSYISNVATTSTASINAFATIPVTNMGVTKLQQLLNGNIPATNHISDTSMSIASTSAPTENTSDICVGLQLPEERVGRQRNNSSTDRSLCSFSSLSLSNDEGFDSSREEFGLEEDDSSDTECGDAEKYNFTTYFPASSSKHNSSNTKRKRYFWQYNIQSKGPKGPKMPLETSRFGDPHFLSAASDPVFSSQSSFSGIKCSGKVRRGDGNDLTPNPHKLYLIGLELKKLSKIINDLEPTIEQPFNTRPKSRREKNKLASRMCRLKKKAQHEANKLKFYGLQKEHNNLCALLEQIKQLTVEKLDGRRKQLISQDVEQLITAHGMPKVAGNTAEFVNHVLSRVAGGDHGGGVYEL